MLDRGSCRRKQVVRYPTRGYQADQPSLTHATRPPNLLALDDHIHIRRLMGLDKGTIDEVCYQTPKDFFKLPIE
jgi:hypothetical protein